MVMQTMANDGWVEECFGQTTSHSAHATSFPLLNEESSSSFSWVLEKAKNWTLEANFLRPDMQLFLQMANGVQANWS